MRIFGWHLNIFGDKSCKKCQGRGKWQEHTELWGIVELNTFFCEACKGTGIKISDEQIDDFDVAGVGATEFDDEED